MKHPKKRNGRGFTLIELLIVVAIIGILAAIAIPNFLQAQVRAKVSRTKADHQGYGLALELYRIDDTNYPPSCGVGPGDEATRYCPDYWTVYCGGVQIPLSVDRFRRLTTPIEYLTSLPTDPFSPALVPDQKYYLYYDSCELDLWIRLASRFPDTLGWVGIPRVGQWMINGAGPDNLYEVSRIFSLVSPPQFLEYDPTNGTVSTGDVFRFGP